MPDHNNCCCLLGPAGPFADHREENDVLSSSMHMIPSMMYPDDGQIQPIAADNDYSE